ncbi:Disease resistance protein Aig2 [Rasamsonia emersonii CBS 393.64]|uniref:Disease resistance protein Aig2 n=1 Tax=Rasamsonia emersonii (strain ATCC 16479 / CBS 393.64 / IMI 116815) TaxID=1408163 RepID=A0A0F4YEG6_RASE3|nr:Disease resistance protein Aig2 [Rasamsonia emersonii CBS 393.64]KKA16587.1 Disease resistance protein Aig2 [Rasamsonia emersonii CBS 393.64]
MTDYIGTLMAPQILHRVIHGRSDPEPWQKALLTIKPAILHGYRRHRVRGADYPGIIPVTAKTSDGGSPSQGTNEPTTTTSDTGHSVLGTLVSGLTDGDIWRLDNFEGSDYEKRTVKVRVLRSAVGNDDDDAENSPSKAEQSIHDVLDAARAQLADEGEEVEAMTYVWIGGEEALEDLTTSPLDIVQADINDNSSDNNKYWSD